MISYIGLMIERIVQYISPVEIINEDVLSDQIDMDRLEKICFAAENNKSEASIEKSLKYLAEWVETELLDSDHVSDMTWERKKKGISFWDLVECFSAKVLTSMENEIVFRYKYMEPWHKLSSKMGCDLFAANAYACYDKRYTIERKSFMWKTILKHDNAELNGILAKGISDNHYHLRASMPYFDLSWISLMNSVVQSHVVECLDSMDRNSRNIRTQFITDENNEKYAVLHLKAVLIRVYLYAVLTDQLIQLENYRVSSSWLLEQLAQMENPNACLKGLDMGQDIEEDKESIRSCIENYFQKKVIRQEQFKHSCPGFYWLFFEKFPYIPAYILPDKHELISSPNIAAITDYLESVGGEIYLQECEDFFRGCYYEKYRAEWKKHMHMTVCRFLENSDKLLAARKNIQSILDFLHIHRSPIYKDYMLNAVDEMGQNVWERWVLSGERWFFYIMFHNRNYSLGSELKSTRYIYDLFFMYIIIKDRFRRELLQNNEKIGFSNFHTYQSRKTWFTFGFTEAELARVAVRDAFRSAKLKSLELRIMPGNTCQDNIMTIQKYDKAIQEGWKKKYFDKYYYVFHFAKKKDELTCKSSHPKYRHEAYREKIKKQTEAILLMREKNREVGRRLRGVDACSSEDGCRPEVFSVVYRVLRNHIVKQNQGERKLRQLRLSYHVGEENQDVLDGIRAIDEAIYFLNMKNGDRLGHATMLGVNAIEWYRKCEYKISIRQQDYLDNVVWLYQKMIQYRLPNQDDLLEYLEKEFHTYFEHVYRKAFNEEIMDLQTCDFDIHNYYAAWELRGDNPEYYSSGHYDMRFRDATIWDIYGINELVDKKKRKVDKITILYYAYHYSPSVREAGKKCIVKQIPFHMIRGIREVQRKMMWEISKKGIAIETNPSSNVMIGGFKDYADHPIVTFYNKGLTDDTAELEVCSQINVSINTDDAGVFMTSLSNEYALMAKALETMTDDEEKNVYKKDMVFNWVNRVRKMGNEQSFLKRLIDDRED